MDFSQLTAYLDALGEQGIPGCDMAVWRDHKALYRHGAGCSDHEGARPVNGKEVYWIYSASKVVTCTSAMQLVEKGLLGLDDPVSKYLPAFANLTVREGDVVRPARTVMTIRHLFAMQGGLDYNFDSPSLKSAFAAHGRALTTRMLVDAIALEPLSFDPGTHYQYSMCHDVLGAVIEVVSGERLGEYMKNHIFTPLGMKTAAFVPNAETLARFAACWQYDDATHTVEPLNQENQLMPDCAFESGGGGLLCDVDDYILLADALACGGMGATGARILNAETIDQMRVNQQSGACQADFDKLAKVGYGYGLGVRTLIEREKSGALSPIGEFGWDGAAGAYVMIDVEKRLSIFYAQHIMGCGYAFNVVHPTLRNLVYEACAAD